MAEKKAVEEIKETAATVEAEAPKAAKKTRAAKTVKAAAEKKEEAAKAQRLKNSKLACRLRREYDFLILDLLSRFYNVDSVIRDTLKVADEMKKLCYLLRIPLIHVTRRQLYKVRTESILVFVRLVLKLANFVGKLRIVRSIKQLHRLLECIE